MNTAFLLQTKFNFFNEADPFTAVLGLVGLVALIGFLAIWNALANKGGKGGGSGRKFSRFAFRRAAKKAGLSPSQIRLLEYFAKHQQLGNPMLLFTSPNYLDSCLRKGMNSFLDQDISDGEKEARKTAIYQIKHVLEANASAPKILPSTASVPAHTEMYLRMDDGHIWRTWVSASNNDMIGVEAKDHSGEPIRLARGTVLLASFTLKDESAFSYKATVLGTKTVKTIPMLFLTHGKNLQQVQKRRLQRREMNRPCYYFPVRIVKEGKGRKAKSQAVVDKASRFLGTIIDISAGGCAIRTNYPIPAGTLVKIDFEPAKRMAITMYGKIRHVTRIPPKAGILHVMFTSVTRTHLNKIRDYVYDYVPEE